MLGRAGWLPSERDTESSTLVREQLLQPTDPVSDRTVQMFLFSPFAFISQDSNMEGFKCAPAQEITERALIKSSLNVCLASTPEGSENIRPEQAGQRARPAPLNGKGKHQPAVVSCQGGCLASSAEGYTRRASQYYGFVCWLVGSRGKWSNIKGFSQKQWVGWGGDGREPSTTMHCMFIV